MHKPDRGCGSEVWQLWNVFWVFVVVVKESDYRT